MLNEVFNLRLKKTFQTISYLPHFISWVVAAGLFRSVLSFEGPINYLLELFGNQRVVFMKDPSLLPAGGSHLGRLENRGLGLDHLSGRHRRHRPGALRRRGNRRRRAPAIGTSSSRSAEAGTAGTVRLRGRTSYRGIPAAGPRA